MLKSFILLSSLLVMFSAEAGTCEAKTYSCTAGTCYKARFGAGQKWSNGVTTVQELADKLELLAGSGLCDSPNATEACQVSTYSCEAGTCYRTRPNNSFAKSSGVVSFSEMRREVRAFARAGLCRRANLGECAVKTYSCEAGTCYRIRINPGHKWSNGIVDIEDMAREVLSLRAAGLCSSSELAKCETTTYSCKAGTCYRVRMSPDHAWSNGLVEIEELASALKTLRSYGLCK